jgi:hypothetical protein
MAFDTLITCHGVSFEEDGITLRHTTTAFRPDVAAIVLYARTAPLLAGLTAEFTARIFRMSAAGARLVWAERVGLPIQVSRWLPQQLIAVWYPAAALEPGGYLGTIMLPDGAEAQGPFIVGS